MLALFGQAFTKGQAVDKDVLDQVVTLSSAHSPATLSGRLANCLAYAQDTLAQDELRSGLHSAAMDRMRIAADYDSSGGWRAAVLSQQGAILLKLGLAHRARIPLEAAIAEARALVAEAEPYFARGETSPGAALNWGGLVNTYLRHARMLLGVNRAKAAAESLEAFAASPVWQAVNMSAARFAKVKALAGACWTYHAERDPGSTGRARNSLREALELDRWSGLDRMMILGCLAQLAIREGDYTTAQEELALYHGVVEGASTSDPALDPMEHCWGLTLQAQAAELAGSPDLPAVRAELETAFAAFLDSRRQIERSTGTAFFRYGRARLALEVLIATAPDARSAWGTLLDAQAVGSFWHAAGMPRRTLDEVEALFVDEDRGILAFLPGKQRTFLLLAGPQGAALYDLGVDANGIYRSCQGFGAMLRSAAPGEPISPSIASKTRELSGILFPQAVRERLRSWRQISIVGRDWIGDLPIEVLSLDNSEPLGCSHAILDIPSLPVSAALMERTPAGTANGPGLVVGAPRMAPEVAARWPELEDLSSHASKLEVLVDDPRTQLVTGKDATFEALASTRSANAAWLQILAHGVLDTNRELWPLVLLAPSSAHPDGRLTAEEARRLRVPESVLLGVCRSGSGAHRLGDAGTGHLGGALLLAGARCVVLPTEDVQLSEALIIGQHWSAGLARGLSGPEALRQARRQMWSQPATAHPSQWGWWRAFGASR